jgi:hypothetical protein
MQKRLVADVRHPEWREHAQAIIIKFYLKQGERHDLSQRSLFASLYSDEYCLRSKMRRETAKGTSTKHTRFRCHGQFYRHENDQRK